MKHSDKLYEMTQKEIDEFTENLRKEKPETIIEMAYEQVIKDDLAALFEEEDFVTEEEAKALCELNHPLDAIYQEWLHNDYSYNDLLRQTVRDLLEILSRKR